MRGVTRRCRAPRGKRYSRSAAGFMEPKVMPVMEIAAKEPANEPIVIEAIVIGAVVRVGAVGEIAVIAIAAIGAGGQAEAEPGQHHHRRRPPF